MKQKAKSKGVTDVTPVGGNVFEDLGFDYEESIALKTKVLLTGVLLKWMKLKQLNQTEAAEILGIKQPEVSKLARGKLDSVSIEKLIQLVERTGVFKVNVSVEELEVA